MTSLPQTNKLLGQHFLVSKKIIQKITASHPVDCDHICEIGPGPAILTPSLKELEKPLFVIEKDERFLPYLEKIVLENHILLGDALEINFEQLDNTSVSNRWWIVSNLPYNVSVPISLKFFKWEKAYYFTYMMQKEVAQKFLPSKKHETSSLMVLSHTFFEVSRVVDVPPGAFQPPPKVDSEVLFFSRREKPYLPLDEWGSLEKFIKKVFAHRRKQIYGVLKPFYEAEKLNKCLFELNISPQERAHRLEWMNVLQLYKALHHSSTNSTSVTRENS